MKTDFANKEWLKPQMQERESGLVRFMDGCALVLAAVLGGGFMLAVLHLGAA